MLAELREKAADSLDLLPASTVPDRRIRQTTGETMRTIARRRRWSGDNGIMGARRKTPGMSDLSRIDRVTAGGC